jgi:hypothetical protein
MNKKISTLTILVLLTTTIFSVAFLPNAQATTTTFGFQLPLPNPAYPSDVVSRVKGSMYTSSSAGVANSISVFVDWNPTYSFGNTVASPYSTIVNTILGSKFSLAQDGIAQSITAYMGVTGLQKKVQAAIYNPTTYQLIAKTEERTFTYLDGGGLKTFNLQSPQALTAGTYLLAIWGGQPNVASGTDNIYLYRDSTNGAANSAITKSQTYASASFPDPILTPTLSNRKWALSCNMVNTPVNIKAALYSDTTFAFIAGT